MEPASTRTAPPGRFASLPLRYPEFRALGLATTLAGTAYVGETVVLGWWLLERTDSPFIVSLGVALRALPNFLFGIPGGALADRVDRRLLLRLAGAAMAVNAGVLGLLALAGQLAVWQLLPLTFVSGGLRSLAQTARQAYAFDIVGKDEVVGGMAFMSLGQRAGSIGGAFGAGLILGGWGAGEAYLAIAACHLLSVTAIMLAKTRGRAAPVGRPAVWAGVQEFVAEVARNRNLALLVLLTAMAEVLGFSHQAVLPSLARDRLHAGAGGLGLLNGFLAVGGLIGVLLLTFRGDVRSKGLVYLVVVLLFGVAVALLGTGNSLTVALIGVMFVGGLAALTDLLAQGLLQSVVANDLRGRAMGSWVLATGLGPIGRLQLGAIAGLFSVTAALMANGLVLVAVALASLLTARGIRRL